MPFFKNIKRKTAKAEIINFITILLSVLMVPNILLNRYGIEPVSNKIILLLFILFDIFLVLRNKLLNNKHILLLVTFLLWMITTSLYNGAGISRAYGGSVVRPWLICVFVFLTAYTLDEDKKRNWFYTMLITISVCSSIFFIFIMCNGFNGLLDTSYLTDFSKGMIQNGRLHGFGNANTVGAVATISITSGTILLCYRVPEIKEIKHPVIIKCIIYVIGIVTVILSILSLSLCRSRAAILSSGVGVFLIIYKTATVRWFKNIKKGLFLSIITAVFAAIMIIVLSITVKTPCDVHIKKVIRDSYSEEQKSEIVKKLTPYGYDYAIDTLTDRTLIWSATINMLNEDPSLWITGVTAADSPETYINYVYEDRPELYAVITHNGYLQNILMYGLPGALILMIILVNWAVSGVKAFFNKDPKDELIFFTVPFGVIGIILGMVETYPFPFWSFHPVAYMFFAMAGLWCSSIDEKKEKSEKKNRILFICSITVIIIFGLANVLYIASTKIMKNEKNNVENRMQSADYLIDNCSVRNQNAEEILLSRDEIEEFNYKNRKKLSSMNVHIALEDVGIKFNGNMLKSYINDGFKEFIDESANNTINTNQLEKAIDYCNLDIIGPNVDVIFAYTINRNPLYKLPEGSEIMAATELMPFEPVIILHSTADGKWLYVLSSDCGGWIPEEIVAPCNNKKDWLSFGKKESDFIVVTDSSINISLNKGYAVSVPMGTVLSAKKGISENNQNGYFLEIPVREDGKISFESVFISENEDVLYNEYLSYTQANIIKQASKLSDNDSLIIKKVYASFGFSLPKNPAALKILKETKKELCF